MLSFSRVLLLKHEDYHFTEIVLSFGSTQFQYFIMECLTMLEFQWQPGIEWWSKHSFPENETQVQIPDWTTHMG